jgi:hypothetical protein
VPASGDSEDDCGEQMECRLAGKTEVLGENLPQRQCSFYDLYLQSVHDGELYSELAFFFFTQGLVLVKRA